MVVRLVIQILLNINAKYIYQTIAEQTHTLHHHFTTSIEMVCVCLAFIMDETVKP